MPERDTPQAVSRENIEIARSLLDAWSTRDVDAILDVLDEEIEWHPALFAGSVEGTVYRGHRDIRSWLNELDDVWAELSYEIEQTRDLGEGRVFMLGQFHAVGQKSGVSLDQPQGFLFKIKDGKIAFGRSFASHEGALEAAGLED